MAHKLWDIPTRVTKKFRVHADVEAQQLLATLLVETFGEAICRANEAPEVQTPESLKLRILLEISGRPADDQFQVAPAAPGLPIITSVIVFGG